MDDTKKARAYADLMRLVNGYQISQAVHVAASLGVADHLHDTACSIEELASLTASHPGGALSVVACAGFRGRSS